MQYALRDLYWLAICDLPVELVPTRKKMGQCGAKIHPLSDLLRNYTKV